MLKEVTKEKDYVSRYFLKFARKNLHNFFFISLYYANIYGEDNKNPFDYKK